MVRDTESKGRDRNDLAARFASAVSSLADGDLTFGRPFDLASSTALADNIDSGQNAQRLFDVTALRDLIYDIQIRARSPEHPDVQPREVLCTEIGSTPLLISLLEDLIEELHGRMEQ